MPEPDPPKHSNAAPRLQKRSSIATLPRASASGLKDTSLPAAGGSSRPPTYGTLRGLPKPGSSTIRASSVRPSSRGNQQRPPPLSTKPAATRPEDEENQDQLTSLSAFRTASSSRQGFRDDDETAISPEDPSLSLDDETFRPRHRTKSRPSLSDRTIESLQALGGGPATPAKGRRRSSFFNTTAESPGMGPPPPPGSALSRNSSGSHAGARPGTSDGGVGKPSSRAASPAKRAPSSARPASKVTAGTTPGGFGFGGGAPGSAQRRSGSTALTAKLQASHSALPSVERSPSPAKRTSSAASSVGGAKRSLAGAGGSKSVAAHPPGAKAAVDEAASAPAHTTGKGQGKNGGEQSGKTKPPPSSSSAALRQQIAAAKAAAKKEKERVATHDKDPPQQADSDMLGGFNPDLYTDPFNTAGPKDSTHILKTRIKIAWTSGKLNIAGLSLPHIPDEVLGMYESKAMEDANVNWAEVVDLTRLIAADNELTALPEAMFPDQSLEELEADEDAQGSPFMGLELLDLHSNTFASIPPGLRHLPRLTTLNLAQNHLDNAALDTLAQLPTLRTLNLARNNLTGPLPPTFCTGLPHLQTLDLAGNKLLALPDAVAAQTALRTLNLSHNQLTALPMPALARLPALIDLDASHNALIGSLFPATTPTPNTTDPPGHPTLQTLHLAHNSLAALTFAPTLHLPSLLTLDTSSNHLTTLPDLSPSTALHTVLAPHNRLPAFPPGLLPLTQRLVRVDLAHNDLRGLDPRVGLMEGLERLGLEGNPLRERRFLAAGVGEVRRVLRGRLRVEAEEGEAEEREGKEEREGVDGDDGGGDEDAGEVSDPETVIGPPPSSSWSSAAAVAG